VTPEQSGQNLDIDEVAAEMNRDPLSRALFENAQYRVLIRRQARRIEQLEQQKAPAASEPAP
jgi:hypothetical protein